MSTLALGSLIPWLFVLSVEALQMCDGAIELHVSSTQPTAACPVCAQPSGAVHSRYVRWLADLPWAGIPVVIHLEVRKLFCRNPTCPRRIFTERQPQMTAPYRRQTQRLWEQQRQLALAHGGEAGARTAARHGVNISAKTMLRRVCHARSLPAPHLAAWG